MWSAMKNIFVIFRMTSSMHIGYTHRSILYLYRRCGVMI